MAATHKPVLLNRAVFTQRSFDSRALTVLTTLVHRFVDAGHYEVFVRRGGAVVHRVAVHVAAEHSRQQADVDMANVPESKRACGCEGDAAMELRTGGVIAFYVSAGTGRYSVGVSNSGAKEAANRIALDSATGIPAGGFFALTLVRPGGYRVTAKSGAEAYVTARLPIREKGYRPDRATLVTLGKDGFNPRSVEILSGQSVVFQCDIAADIQAELVKEEGETPPIDRKRATFRRPAPPRRDAK